MIVNDILSVIDLTNVQEFKVNGTPTNLNQIRNVYCDLRCKCVQIQTVLKDMSIKDIQYDLYSDTFDTVEAYVEMQLPNTPTYISIQLNFILESEM